MIYLFCFFPCHVRLRLPGDHIAVFELKNARAGIYLATLGRGSKAFLIGKISDISPELG